MTNHTTCVWCGCPVSIFTDRDFHEHKSECIAALTGKNAVLEAKIKRLEAFVAAYDDWCEQGILVFQDPDCGLTSLRHTREELDK